MSKIQFGICGDIDHHNTPEELNPLPTLKKEEVGEMILKLNRNPMDKDKLLSEWSQIEDDIEKLLKLNVLKEDGKVYVNFTFLDEKDTRLIFKECEPLAEELCKLFLEKKEDLFEILDYYRDSRLSRKKLAFLIIGCYLLDWGALELFRHWEVANNKKPQPGGNEYTLWGEEEVDQMLKRIYWGGHAEKTGDYVFHTFGDHHGYKRRDALPDILHIFPDFDFRGGSEYRSLLFDKRKQLGIELGDVIDDIDRQKTPDDDKKKHTRFLKDIGYLQEREDLFLTIPYFTDKDVQHIKKAIEPFIPKLKTWTEEDLPILEKKIQHIRPIQNGVPFSEVFIQLWHVVFGLTNKYLTEAGMLYDTYEDGKGYLPGLFKYDVSRRILEELTSS